MTPRSEMTAELRDLVRAPDRTRRPEGMPAHLCGLCPEEHRDYEPDGLRFSSLVAVAVKFGDADTRLARI